MRVSKRPVRSNKGFTLIELLVVVIIIGILAAIALPNFIGAQDKAREASVKANMRTTQIAAEAYATDNGGTYPTSINDAFKSYFPGGGSDGTTVPATPSLVNPFTNINEWPVLGTVSGIQATRASVAAGTGGSQGQVVYCPQTPNTSYAVLGTGKNAKALGGNAPGTTLVLSNQ